MTSAYIVSAVRTPMGKFGGSLRELTPADMGVVVARAALERACRRDGGTASLEAAQINQVIFGCARQAGVGPNVARQIAYRAFGELVGSGIPAFTVNQACASGMLSIVLGWQEIALGRADCVLAGGTESMSRVPYLVEGARWGMKMGHQRLTDAMYRDGFLDPLSELIMGETAEVLAERYQIGREEQDRYALESQRRAAQASASGRFHAEIVPVEVPDPAARRAGKGSTRLFDTDETFRANASLDAMGRLAPVFAKNGSVTAGNASQLTDGAAALLLVSERKLAEWKLRPRARLLDWERAAVDPKVMGIAPVPATRALLERNRWRLEEFDRVELNEAFAAQVLACDRELGYARDKLNVNGGAIALGHPIGCSGARITVTLVHELHRQGGKRGLATLCVSGGLGLALALETA
ncbi:MAG: thiolase family protein [Terriglobia bacterium]